MRRRDVVKLLAGAAIATPHWVVAQLALADEVVE